MLLFCFLFSRSRTTRRWSSAAISGSSTTPDRWRTASSVSSIRTRTRCSRTSSVFYIAGPSKIDHTITSSLFLFHCAHPKYIYFSSLLSDASRQACKPTRSKPQVDVADLKEFQPPPTYLSARRRRRRCHKWYLPRRWSMSDRRRDPRTYQRLINVLIYFHLVPTKWLKTCGQRALKVSRASRNAHWQRARISRIPWSNWSKTWRPRWGKIRNMKTLFFSPARGLQMWDSNVGCSVLWIGSIIVPSSECHVN